MYAENKTAKSGTAVRLSNVRFDRVRLFQPTESGFYSLRIIISKDDSEACRMLRNACIRASILCCGICSPDLLTAQELPYRDGDEFQNEEYWNCFVIDTLSDYQPVVVAPQEEIADGTISDRFYSGCYGIAGINFKPTKNGIYSQLLFCVKVAEGCPLTEKEGE